MTRDAERVAADGADRSATRAGMREEIDADRRSEFRLLYKTAIALAIVAAIAVVRQVFFA